MQIILYVLGSSGLTLFSNSSRYNLYGCILKDESDLVVSLRYSVPHTWCPHIETVFYATILVIQETTIRIGPLKLIGHNT